MLMQNTMNLCTVLSPLSRRNQTVHSMNKEYSQSSSVQGFCHGILPESWCWVVALFTVHIEILSHRIEILFDFLDECAFHPST